MKTLGAAKFRAQCVALLDRVGPEGIVITKRGKPVAKLIAIDVESRALIGSLKGKPTLKGHILSTGLRRETQSRLAHSARRPRR